MSDLKTYFNIDYSYREGNKGFSKEQFNNASKVCSKASLSIKEKYEILMKKYCFKFFMIEIAKLIWKVKFVIMLLF